MLKICIPRLFVYSRAVIYTMARDRFNTNLFLFIILYCAIIYNYTHRDKDEIFRWGHQSSILIYIIKFYTQTVISTRRAFFAKPIIVFSRKLIYAFSNSRFPYQKH